MISLWKHGLTCTSSCWLSSHGDPFHDNFDVCSEKVVLQQKTKMWKRRPSFASKKLWSHDKVFPASGFPTLMCSTKSEKYVLITLSHVSSKVMLLIELVVLNVWGLGFDRRSKISQGGLFCADLHFSLIFFDFTKNYKTILKALAWLLQGGCAGIAG